jgi:hypothetical protein
MKNLVMKNLIDKLIEKHIDPNIEFATLSNRKTVSNVYGDKIKQEEKETIAHYRTSRIV